MRGGRRSGRQKMRQVMEVFLLSVTPIHVTDAPCAGTGGDVLILEEAAYCDEGFFYEVWYLDSHHQSILPQPTITPVTSPCVCLRMKIGTEISLLLTHCHFLFFLAYWIAFYMMGNNDRPWVSPSYLQN